MTYKRPVTFRLLSYLVRYKRDYILALLCMVVFGATDGAVPFLVKYILDDVFTSKTGELLYLAIAVVVGFAVVRGISDFLQQYLSSRIAHYISRDIRNEMQEHLLRMSPGYFVVSPSANLLSRITADVYLVRSFLTESVSSIIRDGIRIAALLGAAFYLDPYLALMAFVLFPLAVLPVQRFGKKVRKLTKQGQEAIGSLSALLHAAMLGNRVVKIFGREEFEKERFKKENSHLTATFVRSEKVRALVGPLNEILASLAISGVILYGGYSVIGGFRSQGDFIAFLISVFLLYDPFKKLSKVHVVMQQGLSGAERIFEILDTPSAITEVPNPLPLGVRNDIEFVNVSFSYRDENLPVINNVSLKIEEGSKVALVGFSGAGKSTLVDLIPRFIDPHTGTVRLGGVDISKVSLRELRARIAMVSQHTFLFHDTIYNNIAYGLPNATRENVIAAAKAAYAFDFISKLPGEFDCVVGEEGFALSGGERQRIAIARAILKNAPILILDEATASLDSLSEREVQVALAELERNRTTVVIAHRLSTIREADLIVVMREGKFVERGNYKELLERGGEFSRLYTVSFSGTSESGDVDEAVVN